MNSGRTGLRKQIRPTFWFGVFVLFAFFVVGGGWAATAKLSGATIASGTVNPQGSRRTVQHLEGGVIREISVREGDVVERGQPLIHLEDIRARAEVDQLLSRIRSLAAQEARLKAERAGSDDVRFSHFSLHGNSAAIRDVREQEINLLTTRTKHDESRQEILKQRKSQLSRQIEGFKRQLTSVRKQHDLILEEISDVQGLFERGLERRPRLLALERAEAELIGTEGDLLSQIARTEEEIGEADLQAINMRISRLEEVDEALSRIQAERIEIESQYLDKADRFNRTIVTAPVAGTVIGLRFRTLGGVIRAGESILDIVPINEALVVEARISPSDIDDVRVGHSAYVMFPSYALRHLKRIDGEVISLSADVIEDERNGEKYFSAKVLVEREHLKNVAPDIELTPGLPAQVFIETEERTFLDYLLQPVILSFERSFRES